MPVRIIITAGTVVDCTKADDLIENIKAEYLFADRGYDSDEIVNNAEKNHMKAVIPPRKNRKILRHYDKDLYKLRHLVENAFMHIKQWLDFRGFLYRKPFFIC